MSVTVLGKRSRGSSDSTGKCARPGLHPQIAGLTKDEDNASIQTRSKRRITITTANDENENPFVTRRRTVEAVDEADDLAVEVVESPVKRARATVRRTPVKQPTRASQLPKSPVPRDSPRKRSKSEVDVYQDGNQERIATPVTPRHRDALKKVVVTPRHRTLVSGEQVTPRSGKKPDTPSHTTLSVYNQARSLFARCSAPGKIIGRDTERAELVAFLEERVQSKSGGCLYVSGPPGTGKSALLGEIIQSQAKSESLKVSVVNCMSVRNTKDLSQKLAEDLLLQEDAGFEYLRSCFVGDKAQCGQKFVVILDEVDQLVDLDLSLLYSLFEWSLEATSNLVLIGIANALDLTDRLLPRLKSRNLKPELLPFMPYSAAQIADVLTTKLKSLVSEDSQVVPFLQPAAIQFCAKKVAAQTGDLRKAFDICQRAIDLVANETRTREQQAVLQNSPSKTPLMENCNLASPPSVRSPESHRPQMVYTVETAPKATIAHMARITAQAFSHGATQRLNALNLQQKAVLCALAALEKRQRATQMQKTVFATPSKSSADSSAPTIKRLFEAYTILCTRERLFHPLSNLEFRDVVSGLEALSLVSPADSKSGSFTTPLTPSRTPGGRKGKGGGFAATAAMGDERRVASSVSVKEIAAAIEGGPGGELLREMLDGDVV